MRSTWSAWIWEAWAVWEMLRRLGFSADDIFWEIVPTTNAVPGPGLALNVVLRAQGKVLTVTCSHRLTLEVGKALEEESREFQEGLVARKFDESVLFDKLHATTMWGNRAGLVIALRSKGFVIVKELN